MLILQTTKERCIVFYEGGVFEVNLRKVWGKSLYEFLPSDTWILFDSNSVVEAPDWELQLSGFFIVEAASPRRARLRWQEKCGGVVIFVMNCPTPGEILLWYGPLL